MLCLFKSAKSKIFQEYFSFPRRSPLLHIEFLWNTLCWKSCIFIVHYIYVVVMTRTRNSDIYGPPTPQTPNVELIINPWKNCKFILAFFQIHFCVDFSSKIDTKIKNHINFLNPMFFLDNFSLKMSLRLWMI